MDHGARRDSARTIELSAIFRQSRLMRKAVPLAGLDWASAPQAIRLYKKAADHIPFASDSAKLPPPDKFRKRINLVQRALRRSVRSSYPGSFCLTLPISAQGSALRCFFALSSVNWLPEAVRASASHDTGIEIGAPARARVE
jgi:hypothetical protein